MQNNIDETRHSEVQEVSGLQHSCCCKENKPQSDETPYCCSETIQPTNSFWQKIKKIFV